MTTSTNVSEIEKGFVGLSVAAPGRVMAGTGLSERACLLTEVSACRMLYGVHWFRLQSRFLQEGNKVSGTFQL